MVLWLYPDLFQGDLQGMSDRNRVLYAPFGDPDGGIAIDALEIGGRPPASDAFLDRPAMVVRLEPAAEA